MYNQFFYLGYEEKFIEGKEFLVIYVLELCKKQIFKIYKTSKIYKTVNNDLISKLDTLKNFDNINDYIGFVIKRDGKISLDINL